jgi:hypothetical protein
MAVVVSDSAATAAMTNLMADMVIGVCFLLPEEGGRNSAIDVGEKGYGCVLLADSKAFECRVLSEPVTLELGERYELPVKFLNRTLAQATVRQGTEIRLWEGKDIAMGQVLRVRDVLGAEHA